MQKITFTAQPMERPKNMSAKAALAWDYFDFGRTWLAVETFNDEIIITDEGADLNDAMIFPGVDSFLDWLEAGSDDKLSDDAKEYLIASRSRRHEHPDLRFRRPRSERRYQRPERARHRLRRRHGGV